jgi:hypothetical protein
MNNAKLMPGNEDPRLVESWGNRLSNLRSTRMLSWQPTFFFSQHQFFLLVAQRFISSGLALQSNSGGGAGLC